MMWNKNSLFKSDRHVIPHIYVTTHSHKAITTIKWIYPSPFKVQSFLRTLFNASLLFSFVLIQILTQYSFFPTCRTFTFLIVQVYCQGFLQIFLNYFCLITSPINFKNQFSGQRILFDMVFLLALYTSYFIFF